MISFHANGVPFIVVGGDEMVERRAVRVPVEGRALLGPTTFPEWRPELKPGELLYWMPSTSSFLVFKAKPDNARGLIRL